MAVETDDDLAAFFDVDEFGEAAVYQSPNPGVNPVPCLVILDRGQGRGRFPARSAGEQGGSAVTSNRRLWAMAGDGPAYPADTAPDAPQLLPDVKRDGLFTITCDGEHLKVSGLPVLDQIGHLWAVELVKVD